MSEFKQQHQTQVKPAKSGGVIKHLQQRKFPWVVLLALLFTIFVGVKAFGVLDKKRDANKMNKAYVNELSTLDQKEQNLKSELDELATDGGVEQEIREKFRVTKEGEQIVVIVPEKTKSEDQDESKGLFSFLRNLFK